MQMPLKYSSMDGFDKLASCAVIVLILSAAVLLGITEDAPARPAQDEGRQSSARHSFADPELNEKTQLARKLLAHNNLEQTEIVVNSLLDEFPFAGEPHMLKGDVLLRRQQPVAAMYEYKNAVELNPDFLDKKTELFQGKKIRTTVEEAMVVIKAGLQENPGNSQMKKDRTTVYYMTRKLAGSCG